MINNNNNTVDDRKMGRIRERYISVCLKKNRGGKTWKINQHHLETTDHSVRHTYCRCFAARQPGFHCSTACQHQKASLPERRERRDQFKLPLIFRNFFPQRPQKMTTWTRGKYVVFSCVERFKRNRNTSDLHSHHVHISSYSIYDYY